MRYARAARTLRRTFCGFAGCCREILFDAWSWSASSPIVTSCDRLHRAAFVNIATEGAWPLPEFGLSWLRGTSPQIDDFRRHSRLHGIGILHSANFLTDGTCWLYVPLKRGRKINRLDFTFLPGDLLGFIFRYRRLLADGFGIGCGLDR